MVVTAKERTRSGVMEAALSERDSATGRQPGIGARLRQRRERPPLRDRLLTAEEAAELLGVKLSTIRQWTYQRRLPVTHPGGGRAARYSENTLLELVERWTKPALRSIADESH